MMPKIEKIYVHEFGYMYNLQCVSNKHDYESPYFGDIQDTDENVVLCHGVDGNLKRIINKDYIVFYDYAEDDK